MQPIENVEASNTSGSTIAELPQSERPAEPASRNVFARLGITAFSALSLWSLRWSIEHFLNSCPFSGTLLLLASVVLILAAIACYKRRPKLAFVWFLVAYTLADEVGMVLPAEIAAQQVDGKEAKEEMQHRD